MSYDQVIRNLPIYKAALRDDWESVSRIFEQDPELMTKPITYYFETPLIVAVGTNHSHHFVKKLVDRIVAIGASNNLFLSHYDGNNPLHYAAKVGNTIDARILVEQNPDMTRVPNPHGNTPLTLAAWHGNKDTLKYLLTVTRKLLPGEEGMCVYTGVAGGNLITLTIQAGFLDIALEIVAMHPNIMLECNWRSQTALELLATKPELFSSGSTLGFWGYLIYSSPSIKNIHDIKVAHIQSNLLIKCICASVIEKMDHDIAWKILGSAISSAIKHGTPEVVEECISTYPDIIWYTDQGFHLSLEAIKQRQERVYNILCQTSRHKVYQATMVDEENENSLHKAAKLAPPHRLEVVTGAALQLQRELRWFKEVENFVDPSYKESLNKKGKTPKMIFIEEHKKLLIEAKQWMKDVSSSCSVVAALIITMAFVGVFTLPGGNEADGKPLFLNKGAFMLFIISDAIALFSSTASVLMFLGILTSRYAQDDFLYALPKRMTIGLIALFLSLAATMIAFSAALALVLQDKSSTPNIFLESNINPIPSFRVQNARRIIPFRLRDLIEERIPHHGLRLDRCVGTSKIPPWCP
ncbi:ankyrin repeat-containing domain, PGG domain protein [Artemisia annua]|uniref:Ankyrin repeat-containing domain, PGG domain protein n=1 Tax=Artemisia annua TaxID=35608 RepID=A0A2U1QF59_ARTAN|nr:ankyrin repeat-containing domain, PGG domain protein [Artemisia annua]